MFRPIREQAHSHRFSGLAKYQVDRCARGSELAREGLLQSLEKLAECSCPFMSKLTPTGPAAWPNIKFTAAHVGASLLAKGI
jgi:hypothetical protein